MLHYLGGEIAEVGSIASKLSPVGAEVDDQSMTVMRFADGKIGYVGSSWTSPGIFAVRVFGSKGLMHYEIDFGTWDTPDKLHLNSTLYIQRGKDGWSKREELTVPESDMFRVELEMFAESCRTGGRTSSTRAMATSPWPSSTQRCGQSISAAIGARRRRAQGRRRGARAPCCLAVTSSISRSPKSRRS